MRSWLRWQDWLVGVVVAVSPLFTVPSAPATAALVVLGVLLVASAVWSLVKPGSRISEWAHMLLGVLLVFAPVVLGYTGQPWATWTSWVAGVVAIGLGAGALPSASSTHGPRGISVR